ncbi:MAG: orotate phosphoribosyltransferase [Dehalococcoidia bacterium]
MRDAGALLEGHFQLTSGKHSLIYVEKFRLLERPPQTEALCQMIADWARKFDPQVVAGPTTGGVIISYEVARILGARGIFAESDNGGRAFKRGFQIGDGERVLVVDDVLSTGGSILDVIAAVRREGGEPSGVAALVDRTAGRTDFGLPFFACLSLEVPAYGADDCPGCRDGTPLGIT